MSKDNPLYEVFFKCVNSEWINDENVYKLAGVRTIYLLGNRTLVAYTLHPWFKTKFTNKIVSDDGDDYGHCTLYFNNRRTSNMVQTTASSYYDQWDNYNKDHIKFICGPNTYTTVNLSLYNPILNTNFQNKQVIKEYEKLGRLSHNDTYPNGRATTYQIHTEFIWSEGQWETNHVEDTSTDLRFVAIICSDPYITESTTWGFHIFPYKTLIPQQMTVVSRGYKRYVYNIHCNSYT